jgi:alpha-beta hydrolase superfamily lysophospholipase
MPSIVGRAATADGTALLTRHWPADEAAAGGVWAGPAWASVLVVHGLGEHSGRYEHVGVRMAAAGLDVYSYDHRGMGGSEGRRGDIERWDQLLDDLAERLAMVRAATRHGTSAGRPVALYGHSMGGLVVAGYCLSERPNPDLVILSAPGLDSGFPAWKKSLARPLAAVAPTAGIPNGIKDEWRSRDPSVGAPTRDDPGCVETTTARFAVEGLREQARVRAGAADGLGCPTLVIHGEDDRLVPVTASAVFEGAPLTTRRTYAGVRHELHNEPEGPAVVEGVIGWIREQVVADRAVDAPTGGTLSA